MRPRVAAVVYWGCIVLAPIAGIVLYRRVPTILAYMSAFVIAAIGVGGFLFLRGSADRDRRS